MTRLALVSDTHNRVTLKVNPADVLIHAGDLTMGGSLRELEEGFRWMAKQDVDRRILVPGNHDWSFENNQSSALLLADTYGIEVLIDKATTIDDIKVYGSPWQPYFCNWAFNFPQHDKFINVGSVARAKWAGIPDDTNLLITHGPPEGLLDRNSNGDPCGCPELAKRVAQLKELKLHVFGHIHEGYGRRKFLDTEFINAAICDGQYRPWNEAVEYEI